MCEEIKLENETRFIAQFNCLEGPRFQPLFQPLLILNCIVDGMEFDEFQ